MEAPKDRIERALCLFVFMISPFCEKEFECNVS
jgi:hypothetical protein